MCDIRSTCRRRAHRTLFHFGEFQTRAWAQCLSHIHFTFHFVCHAFYLLYVLCISSFVIFPLAEFLLHRRRNDRWQGVVKRFLSSLVLAFVVRLLSPVSFALAHLCSRPVTTVASDANRSLRQQIHFQCANNCRMKRMESIACCAWWNIRIFRRTERIEKIINHEIITDCIRGWVIWKWWEVWSTIEWILSEFLMKNQKSEFASNRWTQLNPIWFIRNDCVPLPCKFTIENFQSFFSLLNWTNLITEAKPARSFVARRMRKMHLSIWWLIEIWLELMLTNICLSLNVNGVFVYFSKLQFYIILSSNNSDFDHIWSKNTQF